MNTVKIISIHRDIPFDFWKHPRIHNIKNSGFNNVLIHFDNLDNSFVHELYQNDIMNISNGYFVYDRGYLYVITCFHSIKNCHINKAIFEDKEYILNKCIEVPEFDTAVFKIDISINEELISKYNFIELNKLDTIVPNIKEDVKIHSHESIIKTKVLDIIEGDSGNDTFATIPQISLKKTKDFKSLFGLSGSACYTDKFIGHVFSYNGESNYVNIIPAYCLKYIFSYMLMGNIKFLKSIILEGNICKIKEDDKTMHAYKIDKNLPIEYKTEEKSYNFKKGSLIFEFDKMPISESGKIYFEQMNIFVTPQVYTLLNNQKENFQVKGYELVTGNYSIFETKIVPINLIDNVIFSSKGHYKILIYKNLIFCELSRDILDLISVDDIKLKDKLENPYTKKYSKGIILIDILDKCTEKISNLKKNINNFVFLNKINKKPIDTLEDLSIEINNSETNSFMFELKKSTYKNFVY
jgi:hypothetical protein